MARQRSGRPAKPSPSTTKAKSKSKASTKRPSSNFANAYTFTPAAKGKATARSRIDEEEREAASGKGKGKGKAREEDDEVTLDGIRMGGGDEELAFDDDEDEDIDSDEADTDGEAGPSRPPPKQTTKAKGDIDLDEDSEDSEEEGFDIDEMLDRPDILADMGSSDSDDEVDEVESASESGLDKLDAFVTSLPAETQQVDEQEEAPRKRRRLQERTEASTENEFAAIGVRDQGKLRLEDLLSTLPAAQRTQLKRTLRPLATADTSTEPSKNPIKGKGPLPAPLPHLYQEKIDRQAANELLGKEIETWNDTLRQMKGIGRAGQEFGGNRLSLPLGAPTGASAQLNAADVMARYAPSNDLEKSVASILTAANLNPKDLTAAEQTALSALPAAEASSRLAEVRRQRELLFRAERKAKRVSKIKSKTYHRLQKRARQRAEAEGEITMEEAEGLDRVDGGDRARGMREEMERRRAVERATLRHAPGASKWSQAMKGVEGLDEHSRVALQERAERAEQLRRKVLGQEDDEGDSDVESADDDDADEEAVRARAFDELAGLEAREAEANEGKSTGLAGMKFMQRADAIERQRADDLAADFKAELEGGRASDDDDEEEEMHDHRVQGNAGRFSYAPSTKQQVQDSAAPTSKREQKVQTAGPVDLPAPPRALPNPFASLSSFNTEANASSNPWLSLGKPDASKKISRKRDDTVATASDKVVAKADKRKKRSEDSKQAAAEEAKVIFDPDVAMEEDEEEQPVHIAKRQAAFDQQHELVARAFANDDVVEDFAEAKRKEAEADAPHEVDDTLPGWGAWGGKGARKSKKPRVVRQVPGIDASARKDAKLSHVIISERRDKKSTKYLVKDLPFPYTSAAQREQALRQPLGREWATATTMKVATKPEVLHRPGVLIRPVAKPKA